MEIIIIWMVPMIIAYFLAKERNRSWIKAIFCTLILGWLGLILMALFLKNRDAETGFLK